MLSPDMANKWFRIPVLLAYIIASSCSIVKENRDACPCNLEVEISGVKETPATLLVKSLRDSSYVQLLSVSRDTTLTLFVPRGGVSLSAWCGSTDSESIIIPHGSEAPPLYLYHGKVEAAGELAYADVKLRKQFCTVFLEIEGPPGWGPPIGTAVRGSACGMSLNGGILQGDFSCSLTDSLRLPRQHPDSQLLLDIVMADNVIRTFSLGALLQKSGYDWTAPDLEDITVHLDLSVSAITFTTPEQSEPAVLTIDI